MNVTTPLKLNLWRIYKRIWNVQYVGKCLEVFQFISAWMVTSFAKNANQDSKLVQCVESHLEATKLPELWWQKNCWWNFRSNANTQTMDVKSLIVYCQNWRSMKKSVNLDWSPAPSTCWIIPTPAAKNNYQLGKSHSIWKTSTPKMCCLAKMPLD